MRRRWKRILAAAMAACIIFGDSSLVYAAESTQPAVETSEMTEFSEEIIDEEVVESAEDEILEETVTEVETEISESFVEKETTVLNSEKTEDSEIVQIPMFSEVFVNPLYKDVVTEEDILKGVEAITVSEEETSTYTTIEAAAELVREQLVKRSDAITFSYEYEGEVAKEDILALADSIFGVAVEHTGNPKEGDYLRWTHGGYSRGGGGYYENGISYLTMQYAMSYYTSAEQEAVVDDTVDSLLDGMQLDGKTDYAKICSIYDYICSNVTYDYTNLNNDDYKLKYTAYAALLDKTAVCQGYSLLFYRLALEEGIDARLIGGIGNGGPHGWNIVELNNTYYNLDATWDAGRTTYSYFLKSMDEFPDHIRDEEYLTESFMADYAMSETSYVETINNYTGSVEGDCLYLRSWELMDTDLAFDDELILNALEARANESIGQVVICYPEGYSQEIPANIWNKLSDMLKDSEYPVGFCFSGLNNTMDENWFVTNLSETESAVKLNAELTLGEAGKHGSVIFSNTEIPAENAWVCFNTAHWNDGTESGGRVDYPEFVAAFGTYDKEFELISNGTVAEDTWASYIYYSSSPGNDNLNLEVYGVKGLTENTTYNLETKNYKGTVEGDDCLYIRHWEVTNMGGTFDDTAILSALQSWDRTFNQVMICYPENYSTTIPSNIWNAVKERKNNSDSFNGFLFDGGMSMNINWYVADMETVSAPVKLDASMTIVGLGMCYGDVTVSGTKNIPAEAHIRFNSSKWKDDGGEVEKNDYQTIIDAFGQNNKEFDLYLNNQVIDGRSDRYEWYKSEDGDHYNINADICLFNVEELEDGTYQMVYKRAEEQEPEEIDYNLVLDKIVTIPATDDSYYFDETFTFTPEVSGKYYLDCSYVSLDDVDPRVEYGYGYKQNTESVYDYIEYMEMEAGVTYELAVYGEVIPNTPATLVVREFTGSAPERITYGHSVNIPANEVVMFEIDGDVTKDALVSFTGDIEVLGEKGFTSNNGEHAIIFDQGLNYIQVKGGESPTAFKLDAFTKQTINVGDTILFESGKTQYYLLNGEANLRYGLDISANDIFIVYDEDGVLYVDEYEYSVYKNIEFSKYYDSIYVILQSGDDSGFIYFGPGEGRMNTVPLELNKSYSSGINTVTWRGYKDSYTYTPEKDGYYYFTGDVENAWVYENDAEEVKPAYYSLNEANIKVCHYYLKKGVSYNLEVAVDVPSNEEAVYQFVEDTVGDTATELIVDGDTVTMKSGETKIFRFEIEKGEFLELSATGDIWNNWEYANTSWGKEVFYEEEGTYYVFVTANENLSLGLKKVTTQTIKLDEVFTIPNDKSMLYEVETKGNTSYWIKMYNPTVIWGYDANDQLVNLDCQSFANSSGESWTRVHTEAGVVKIGVFTHPSYVYENEALISENYTFENVLTSWKGTITVPAESTVEFKYEGQLYGDYYVEEPNAGVWDGEAFLRNAYTGFGVNYKYYTEKLNGLVCKGYQIYNLGDNSIENVEFAFQISNDSAEDMTFNLKTNEDYESKVFNEGDEIRWSNDYWWMNGECNFQYYAITPNETKIYHLSECDWIYRASDHKSLSNRTLLEAGETYYVRVYGTTGITTGDITETTGIATAFVNGNRVQKFTPSVLGKYYIDADCELMLWDEAADCFKDVSGNEWMDLEAYKSYIFWSFGDGRIGLNREVTILDYDYYHVFTGTATGGSVTLKNGKLDIIKNEQNGFTLKEVVLSLFGIGSYKDQPKKDYVSANSYWTSKEGSFAPTEYYLLNADGTLTECADRTVTAGDVLVVKYEPEYVWVDRLEMEVGDTILTAGESTTLKVTPYAATEKYGFKSEPEIRIMTSNPEIADILPDGTIETYKAGAVDIIVYADESLKCEMGLEDTIVSESITITVEPKSEDIVLEYSGTVEQSEDGDKLYIRSWEMNQAGVPCTEENVLSILNKRISNGESFVQVFISYPNGESTVDKDIWNAVKALMSNKEWSAGFSFSNENYMNENWFVADMQDAEEDIVFDAALSLGAEGECGSVVFGNTDIPAGNVYIRFNTSHWNDGTSEGGRDDYGQFVAAFGTESCDLNLKKDGIVLENATAQYEYVSTSPGNDNLNVQIDCVNELEANVSYELSKKSSSGENTPELLAPAMELAKDANGNVIGVKVTNQMAEASVISLEWYDAEHDVTMFAWQEYVNAETTKIVLFSEMNLWGYGNYSTLRCFASDYETETESEKVSLEFAIEADTKEYTGNGIVVGHGITSDNEYQYYYISEEQIPAGASVSAVSVITKDSDTTLIMRVKLLVV